MGFISQKSLKIHKTHRTFKVFYTFFEAKQIKKRKINSFFHIKAKIFFKKIWFERYIKQTVKELPIPAPLLQMKN